MEKHDELRQKVAYEVVKYFETQTKVALVLGYSDVRNVTNWTTGKRWFPTKHCVTLEKASGGELKRQRLRPFDYAEHWPELAKTRKSKAA